MNNTDREKIRSNLVDIVKGLTLDDEFMASLEAQKILTTAMVEELKAIPEMTKRTSHFASSLLPRRGPKAFEVFIQTCVLTGQDWIAQMLDPDLAAKYYGTEPRVMRSGKSIDQPSYPNPPVGGGGQPNYPIPFPQMEPIPDEDPTRSFITTNIPNVNPLDPITRQLLNDTDNVYRMSKDPRGRCIIINNSTFTRMSERLGSNFDAVNLSELFRKLHFNTDIWTNKTAEEIIKLITIESGSSDMKNYDCFVMVVLSHGNRGVVYGMDTEKVKIDEEIVQPFDSLHCPDMAGKPKIFFIQACQGDEVTLGVPVADGPEDSSMSEGSLVDNLNKRIEEMKLTDDPDSVPILPSTHEKSDILLAYSTVPGYKSWRHPELGSWFMRDLVMVLSHRAHTEHLLDMLTQVGKRMSDRQVAIKGFVQINETRTTLRKKLFFFPGYTEKC